MSSGPRIDWNAAKKVAETICREWSLPANEAIVGSVRRMRDTVGDLELVAPHEPESSDRLFRAINRRMSNPWQDTRAGLFAPQVETFEPMGRIEKGLKPGFLAASLVLTPWQGVELPCQVYRYTPASEGWVKLMRTGPREFGMWFLGKWKARHGIPLGRDDRPACVNGHLVDADGKVVSVPTEVDCFMRAQIPVIDPWKRDEFAERLQARKGGA